MRNIQAVLFDLDGVLVPTTVLHMQAWQDLFDAALPEGVAAYTDKDYFQYVDGKPRYEGVASVLESRGITLPQGDPQDDPGAETVCGLGNRKNDIFERLLEEHGIEPYDDTVDVLRHYAASGKRLAVVSSSNNAREVLRRAGIIRFFDEVVDGEVRSRHGLRGKPAPDTFLYGAQLLHADVDETAVFEDAISGIKAARAGNFGFVVGVNRGVGEKALYTAGADTVVSDLVEAIDSNASSPARRLAKAGEDPLRADAYPIDPWRFVERRRPGDDSGTLFSVSNGTIGMRGAGASERVLGNGTFLSGFHENAWITYPENSYGLARVDQQIQGVPDASDFHIFLDGYPIDAELSTTAQEIDMRSGISTIREDYVVGPGRSLTVKISRMACLFEPNLAVITLDVDTKGLSGSSLEIEGRLNVLLGDEVSFDDPRKSRVPRSGIERILHDISGAGTRPRRGSAAQRAATGNSVPRSTAIQQPPTLAGSDIVDVYRCQNSRLMMAVGLRQYVNGQRTNSTRWRFYLGEDTQVSVVRYAAYHNFALEPRGVSSGLVAMTRVPQDAERLVVACRKTLGRYGMPDAGKVLRKQHAWLTRFWRRSEIKVDVPDGGRVQQAVHWELFELAQSCASVPNGISAKGLSGTGYGGHYFWDTEIYVLPFLVFTDPAKARKVLEYRYRMLPAARRRAAVLNLDGALFPWRTINGEEASAYFPAGTAQYHINADIAYAVEQYVSVSDDLQFLYLQGIDILVETARMWASIGFVDKDHKYHIHRVTGPDEYSALVDDNFYTNMMARFNLSAAYSRMQRIKESNPNVFQAVADRLNLGENEMQVWKQCADQMFVPFDEQLGIHAQDVDFLHREQWDSRHLKARPLLLHYHSLEIYRKQIIKQPDVVMALLLLDDRFSLQQKTADYEYYDRITTGDSTLSAAIQSIIGGEVGQRKLANEYFREALFADLANLHRNTSDGVHLASAGGIWLALIEGFAGLREQRGRLAFSPRLPEGWKSMSFRISAHGTPIDVTVTPQGVRAHSLGGDDSFLTVS
ncbi:HAD-IA family hydrolase [Bifidobacterium sp.]|uniref:HAD-IA family hydrolase n=1 Tax=Bifidobacterium sp. TaxID=41200 RepID=UPI0025C73B61|nr:HAD-IA family hydrolase [Bifidobacterium sp.]MCH4208913.1 HAD-IA family hydrolase [Bifidobacterium sp.]MCI1224460.1 HAD-IA family hydrolase [Bifidobacterium sp.]